MIPSVYFILFVLLVFLIRTLSIAASIVKLNDINRILFSTTSHVKWSPFFNNNWCCQYRPRYSCRTRSINQSADFASFYVCLITLFTVAVINFWPRSIWKTISGCIEGNVRLGKAWQLNSVPCSCDRPLHCNRSTHCTHVYQWNKHQVMN